jgi:PAS domain S-box-containing protein
MVRRMVNVDGLGVLVFALPEGRLVAANGYFLRMFGYTREEIEQGALTWRTLTPPEYDAVSAAQLAGLAATGWLGPYEKEYLRKDGSRSWMVFAGVSLGDDMVIKYCIDVSDRNSAEKTVRFIHERIGNLARHLSAAVYTCDAEGRLTFYNRRAAELWGHEPRLGDDQQSCCESLRMWTPDGVPVTYAEGPIADAVREGRVTRSLDVVIERPTGSRVLVNANIDPLYDREGRLAGAINIFNDVTDRKANDEPESRVATRTTQPAPALDALEAEMARRRNLARQLGTAQEDERRRVSRDLYDTISQLVAGLSLAFKAIETSGPLPAATAATLAEAQQVTSALGKEVHGLAVRLRPTSLDDIGLEAALEQLVAEWSSRSGVPAELNTAGLGPGRLIPEIETAVYRVAQEALTNVARHAGASVVGVVVSRTDGSVTAVIEDNGAGFDREAVPRERLGLVGMQERVALVGGELEVESELGSGTTVYARIPLPPGDGEAGGRIVKVLRVYLADDHPLVRSGLRSLIDSQPDMTVVGEAPDGETAVREAAELRPDVVVMDVSMPGIGGVESTRQLRASCPGVRVVALTAHEDRGYRQHLLDAGASSLVVKRTAAEELVQAVRAAAAGEADNGSAETGHVATEPARPSGGGPAGCELSEMEAEVLRLIASGGMRKEIAERLGISVKMVDTFRAVAAEKLGLATRVKIVEYALERGWLS